MYYRISTYKVRPGKVDELFAIADRLRPELNAVPGLKTVHGIHLSDDSYMTVAVYESREAAEAATETAQKVWAQMADCIDLDSLTPQTGAVVWEL